MERTTSEEAVGVGPLVEARPGAAGDPGRTDLVLIYPPWASLGKRGVLQNNLPPLGILSIAAYAEAKGYRVRVIDVHAGRMTDVQVMDQLREYRPRFAGISVLTNMAIPAHRIAQLVKEVVPDCVVVAGGVHAEAMPEQMLRNAAIDCVVRGDGEEAMIEILAGRPWDQVRGLSYRKDGAVANNLPRPVEMDLDRFPFPAYHMVDFKRYFPAVGSYRNLPAINMLMTRGCPGKCTFCNSAFTTLRSRSAESVVEQIKLLRYRYGIRQIQFYDDTFTVAKKTVLAFCKKMVDDKVDVSWVAYIRGDCFSEDMASAMKAAGCHQVLIGIETGDVGIMQTIRKPIDKDRYRKTIEIAHKHGLEVRGSFIIGNLGETWETMENSLQFARELDIDLFQLNINTPYPGTQLYKYAFENGLLVHTNWEDYGQGSVILHSPTLPASEIYRFEKHAFRSFYMRPKMFWRQLQRVASWRQIKDLVNAFAMLILGAVLYKHPEWECWNRFKPEDFEDHDFSVPPQPRLTWELRQREAFEMPELDTAGAAAAPTNGAGGTDRLRVDAAALAEVAVDARSS